MKNIFILTSILVLLMSCKNEIDYSATYVSDVLEINSPRLFTASGEIKNPGLVSNFLNRQDQYHYFKENTSYNRIVALNITIEFMTSNEANITYGDSKPMHVITNGDIIYLESKDTLDLMYSYLVDYNKNIYQMMLAYTPFYSDTIPLDNNTGFTHTIKSKPCFYLTKSKNKLKFPFLTYMYVQPFGKHAGTFINNAFNDNCLSLLGTSDTLVIQQTTLMLEKE